jgi:hypothetical protein
MVYNHCSVRVRGFPPDLGYDQTMSKRLDLWNRTTGDSSQQQSRTKKRVRLRYGRSYDRPSRSEPPAPAPAADPSLPPPPPAVDPALQPAPPPEPAAPRTRGEHSAGRSGRFSHVPRAKRRRCAISVSVSEEEEALIRAHVGKLDQSMSSWIRGLMFRAMGRRVPPRRS